ncbi:hypothetical protein [Pantoea agglomerans]|nr:hypothetical protein [Pantoea agglomerans]
MRPVRSSLSFCIEPGFYLRDALRHLSERLSSKWGRPQSWQPDER